MDGAALYPVLTPVNRPFSTVLQRPRFEDYGMEYLSGNMLNYLGDGFHMREYDGHDLTWYYGLLDGKDEQPKEALEPVF